MHPARPMASSCVGDGPAAVSPSTVNEIGPLVASNRRSARPHEIGDERRARSAAIDEARSACGRVVTRARTGLAARWRGLLHPRGVAERWDRRTTRQRQPRHRQHHQHVAQVLTVDAVGTVGLGGPVQRLAVRERGSLRSARGNRRSAAAPRRRPGTRPSPGRTAPGSRGVRSATTATPRRRRTACRRWRRRRCSTAPTCENSVPISSAVSMPSRVIISSVNRNTPSSALAPALRADAARLPSISDLSRLACRHMCTMSERDEHRRRQRQHAFPQRLVRRALKQHGGADAEERSRRRCPSARPAPAGAGRSCAGRPG